MINRFRAFVIIAGSRNGRLSRVSSWSQESALMDMVFQSCRRASLGLSKKAILIPERDIMGDFWVTKFEFEKS